MKIGFYSYYFTPLKGGIETNTHSFAKELIKLGHEVHVFTSKPKYSPNNNEKLNLSTYEIIDNIHVHRIEQKPKLYPLFILQTMNEVRKANPDIMHCQGLWTGFQGLASRFLLNKKYIIQGHGSDIYIPHKLMDIMKKFIYYFSSGILAISPDMKYIMQKSTNKHIEMFSNGINVDNFKKTNPNGNDIIFVGRLHKIKGIEYLIDSLKYVRNNIHIHIIGDGDERGFLEGQSCNYRNKVTFYGQKSNEEIPKYLSKAKIFVLPSISEGQGIVLLEAMASGLPIIASNVGGIPSVVKNNKNGFLIPSKDSESIAEKIDYILDNKDVWNLISNENIKKAKQFDIKLLAKKLEKIYEDVL